MALKYVNFVASDEEAKAKRDEFKNAKYRKVKGTEFLKIMRKSGANKPDVQFYTWENPNGWIEIQLMVNHIDKVYNYIHYKDVQSFGPRTPNPIVEDVVDRNLGEGVYDTLWA